MWLIKPVVPFLFPRGLVVAPSNYTLVRRVAGSLQGEVVHWLACSLYAACRKGSTPTVGKGLMEGNCVSLTRILRYSKLRWAKPDESIQYEASLFNVLFLEMNV